MSRMSKMRELLRPTRPFNQNFVMGLILFCDPGIYVALTGLGAGGGRPTSSDVAAKTNAILYGIFALFGWIGGSILNILRPKYTIVIGALGYPLYVGGLWYFDRVGHTWFPYFAGAVLGATAGCLWTASGFISFAYPEERDKGTYISIQYILHSFGAMVGGFISFGVNIDQTKAQGVSTAVYSVFIVIMSSSILLSLFFIVDPKQVVRPDGTHIAVFKKETTVKTELLGILELFLDKRTLILIPAMFVAEFPLAMMSSINAFVFNLRTRSLNNVIFQLFQIIFPYLLSVLLDTTKIPKRRIRGLLGVGIMGTVIVGACSGLIGWLKVNHIDQTKETALGKDWTSAIYPGITVVYLIFGIIYSGFQIVTEWVIAAFTNEPARSARYAGLFRGFASLGMCISFILDSQNIPYLTQLIVQFVIYIVGLGGLVYIVWFHITDTNYFAEDDVIVPHHIEEEAKINGLVTEDQIVHEIEKEQRAKERLEKKDAGAGATADVAGEISPA